MVVLNNASNVAWKSGTPLHDNSTKLFESFTKKSVTFRNRIVVSPMCTYSADDGKLNDFHVTHYGSFALRGAGLVIIEATAVEPQGRISPGDSGIWSDEHIEPLKRVVDMVHSQGAMVGIQIAHAGRKASCDAPWAGGKPIGKDEGGWPDELRAPSALTFDKSDPVPKEMTKEDIQRTVDLFVKAAERAQKAGVDMIELHFAHGYLSHNFLSGNSNKRTDEYGGSLENRMRFPLEAARAVRAAWPQDKPLWTRISSTDYRLGDALSKDPEGWDLDQAITFSTELKKLGVDVIDCSSGGNLPGIKYPPEPLYQVVFAEAIKHQAGIETAAVGRITNGTDAERILQEDKADYVVVGREYLRNPGWAITAAEELGVELRWPKQYAWVFQR